MRRMALIITATLALCGRSGAENAQKLLESATLFGERGAAIARMEMRIQSRDGEKTREIELMIDHGAGKVRTVARIVSPSFLTGMKFLKIREAGKPDAQWLRTSSGVRRLGESNKSETIFGSNFTVEDFGAIDATGFDIALLPAKDSSTARAVRALPKTPTYYHEKILWVEKDSSLVSAMEYHDPEGRVLKRYEVMTFSATRDHPIDAKMIDPNSGTTTLLHIISLEMRPSLSDRFFSPGAL